MKRERNLTINARMTPGVTGSGIHTELEQFGVAFAVRMTSPIDLVVCDILVPHGVQDIANNNGLYVVEQYVKPHGDDCDGEAIANKQNRFISQGVTNADGGDGKSSVGEHHSPPTQVEIDSP